MKTVAKLRDRLRKLHERTAETPLFNPVFQLSHDLSRELENGGIARRHGEPGRRAGVRGAAKPCRAPAPPGGADQPDENLARVAALLDEEDGFSEFRARWEKPLLHAVFTAHPTFLLNPAQADAVASAALADDPLAPPFALPARPQITLEFEHLEVCDAIERAGAARDRINATLLAHAHQRWPGRWLDFRPLPFRFATWVGYDMDGRTDIGWHTSIAFRLREKARRLGTMRRALQPGARSRAGRHARCGAGPCLRNGRALRPPLTAPEALAGGQPPDRRRSGQAAQPGAADPRWKPMRPLPRWRRGGGPGHAGRGHARRRAGHGLDPLPREFLAVHNACAAGSTRKARSTSPARARSRACANCWPK
jgi:hypothetical protein